MNIKSKVVTSITLILLFILMIGFAFNQTLSTTNINNNGNYTMQTSTNTSNKMFTSEDINVNYSDSSPTQVSWSISASYINWSETSGSINVSLLDQSKGNTPVTYNNNLQETTITNDTPINNGNYQSSFRLIDNGNVYFIQMQYTLKSNDQVQTINSSTFTSYDNIGSNAGIVATLVIVITLGVMLIVFLVWWFIIEKKRKQIWEYINRKKEYKNKKKNQ